MRVALVHDWLTGMRGGEWCLEELALLYPEAPIFTLVHRPGSVSRNIESHPIHTSFLDRLPGGKKHYRRYLPLMPLAAESFALSGYELILSTSHCVAKGVRPAAGACHISYVHTPMRYVWHLFDDYARGRNALSRAGMAAAAHYLRIWDVASSARVDHFLANSRTVARRIEQVYRRPAEVIHPPVDTDFFRPPEADSPPEDYYLLVSALVPYKRVDLALNAFRRLGRRLLVVGDGPDLERLRRAAGPGIEFLGWQSREGLRDLYRGARALVFPGLEDFGMAPVESLACGRPVVAYGRGGVTESVRGPVVGPAGPTGEQEGTGPGITGCFFRPQSAEALARAVEELDRMTFAPQLLRARAREFDRMKYRSAMAGAIERLTKTERNGTECGIEAETSSVSC